MNNTGRLAAEAWAWGFDPSTWRAHLNPLTWPEVLRQFAIAAGEGPERPQRRGGGPGASVGMEGEDVQLGDSGIRLVMPSRFGAGTVKAAAWQVRLGDT